MRNRIRFVAVPGATHLIEAAIIQGQVEPETSDNIIEKGLALRPKQSGSVVARPGTEVRLDPAPPASSPVRGFSGDGTERRREPNGGSGEIDRYPIVAPFSGIAAR
jgi:hypothetical protein